MRPSPMLLSRRTRTTILCLLAALLPALLAAPGARAVSYNWEIFNLPDSDDTEAFGINNNGQVVGFYRSPLGTNGFLKDGSTYTTLDDPDAGTGPDANTGARGINDDGLVVGYYQVSSAPYEVHGFEWAGSTYTTLDAPGTGGGNTYTLANGINSAGSIIGSFSADRIASHAFLKEGATYTPFDFPGAISTEAWGINDAGQIVGDYLAVSHGLPHGFLKDGTNYTTIDFPGAQWTEAYGINGAGQIVGRFADALGNQHGFLTDGVNYTQLDLPFAWVRGINDAGQLVGFFGQEGTSLISSFIATPVPEPTPFALVSTGLLAFAAWRRHRGGDARRSQGTGCRLDAHRNLV